MRRRRPDPSKAVGSVVTDAGLERRLTDLYRGASAALMLKPGDSHYDTEKAAAETIASSDDERRPLAERVQARETLLASMGRLDQAKRHVKSAQAGRTRGDS